MEWLADLLAVAAGTVSLWGVVAQLKKTSEMKSIAPFDFSMGCGIFYVGRYAENM